MKVAVVDPGETTGLILFETRKRELVSSYADIPERIVHELNKFSPEQVVIEADPFFSTYNSKIVSMIMYSISGFPCTVIGPGEWKPLAKAQKWSRPFGTPHENDAYCMLRYWFIKVFKEDLGDLICE